MPKQGLGFDADVAAARRAVRPTTTPSTLNSNRIGVSPSTSGGLRRPASHPSASPCCSRPRKRKQNGTKAAAAMARAVTWVPAWHVVRCSQVGCDGRGPADRVVTTPEGPDAEARVKPPLGWAAHPSIVLIQIGTRHAQMGWILTLLSPLWTGSPTVVAIPMHARPPSIPFCPRHRTVPKQVCRLPFLTNNLVVLFRLCLVLKKKFGFRYNSTFVFISQILSNHELTRIKRFVSRFTDKLCN